MANPYTDRLNELDSKRVNTTAKQLGDMIGIPLRKPGNIQAPNGGPLIKPDLPDQTDSYKGTTFWANFDHHRQNDPHFDSMTDELTKLSTGLRKQVEQGYMPPQLAQDQLHQFIIDSFGRRAAAQPALEKMQQQKAKQGQVEQLLGVMAQQAQNNPAPGSPQDQESVQPKPAIENLSDQGSPTDQGALAASTMQGGPNGQQ